EGEGIGPEVEQLLAALIELSAATEDGGDLGSSDLGRRLERLVLVATTVDDGNPSGVHAQSILEEVDGGGAVDGLGRHQVAGTIEPDVPGRSHGNGDSQRQVFRKHTEGPQPRELLAPARFRNHARGAARQLDVDLV